MPVKIQFDLTLNIPTQDLDLLDNDKIAQAIESRLHDAMGHYLPTVERRTSDSEIKAQMPSKHACLRLDCELQAWECELLYGPGE